MSTRNNILERLRDPIWQAIAAIVSIVAFLAGIWVAYDVLSKSRDRVGLGIFWVRTEVPNLFERHKDLDVKVTINGEMTKAIRIDQLLIRNSGNAPIKPEDFIEPLSVSVQPPLRLLAVSQPEPRRERFFSPPEVSWMRASESQFRLQPLLLNPGESFEVTVYIGAPSESHFKDFSGASPSWTARIINLPKLQVARWDDESRSLLNEGLFSFFIYYQGTEVFLLVTVGALLFAIGFKLGRERFRKAGTIPFGAVIALATLSFCFADVIIDVLRNRTQPPAAAAVSFAYGALVLWLALGRQRRREPKKRGVNDKARSAAAVPNEDLDEDVDVAHS